jgi:hypothetical protein
LRLWGSGFGVYGLRFGLRVTDVRFKGLRCRVCGLEFRITDFGLRDKGVGVCGLGFRI